MKKLQQLFTERPSYMKWGVTRLCQLTGLSENTVKRMKNSSLGKSMKKNYLNNL